MLTRSPAPVHTATDAVCLYWLCYGSAGRVDHVVIIGAHSLMAARMHATIDGLDSGVDFVEGYSLDAETSTRVPPEMIGRRLSLGQAGAALDAMYGTATARASKKAYPATTR